MSIVGSWVESDVIGWLCLCVTAAGVSGWAGMGVRDSRVETGACAMKRDSVEMVYGGLPLDTSSYDTPSNGTSVALGMLASALVDVANFGCVSIATVDTVRDLSSDPLLTKAHDCIIDRVVLVWWAVEVLFSDAIVTDNSFVSSLCELSMDHVG